MRLLPLAFCAAASVWGCSVLADQSGISEFVLEGALDGRYEQAKCSLRFSKYGKNWTLQLVPEKSYSPAANLFFSPKFGSPGPGSYPVQYSYRGSAETLGGSVTSDDATFSYDTDGQVEFTRFDDRVVGTFTFVAKNDDGATVSAEGAFDCLRGEALQ